MFRRRHRPASFAVTYPSAREIAARLKGETRPDGSGNYSLPLPRPHAQERRRQSLAQRQGRRERATASLLPRRLRFPRHCRRARASRHSAEARPMSTEEFAQRDLEQRKAAEGAGGRSLLRLARSRCPQDREPAVCGLAEAQERRELPGDHRAGGRASTAS